MQLKPSRKSILKFGAVALVGGLAFFFYTNDSTPPQLTDFSFAPSATDPATFEFSGRITDERGVSKAFFRCLDGEAEKMVLDVAMSGSSRNQVSFGLISKSPHWAGNWKGTSYDLSFQGQTSLPEGFDSSCIWQVELSDALGNKTTQNVK
jgi:hypothetical protein